MHLQESTPELQAPCHGERNLPGGQSQVYDPFRASVRGIDSVGKGFRVETVLDSFGPHELQVRLAREISEGARLFALIHLSDVQAGDEPPLRVAVRGIAVSVEKRPSRTYVVTISITSRRLL